MATSAWVTSACSDSGYQGPLLASGGGGMASSSAGTAGSSVVPNAGTSSAGTAAGGMTTGSGGMTTGTSGSTTGGSSGPETGGTGGAAGGSSGSSTGGSGGSGGAAMEQSPIPMDMLQHKWRYTHTCKFLNGQPISNFPTCSTGNNDICTETADGGRWFDMNPPVWKFGGDPNKVYEIKIRMRAISEPKTYVNCVEVNTRTDQGTHPMVCDGTGKTVTHAGENFNVLNFRITDPRQDFYMNMAPVDEPHRVEKLDETFAIKARGGTSASFLFDDLNGGEIRNCPKYTFPGMPDVAPYDNTAIDGEFWQWDCADAAGGDACWKVSQ
jgi:hypothetical protein